MDQDNTMDRTFLVSVVLELGRRRVFLINTKKLTGFGRKILDFILQMGLEESEEFAPWWSDSGDRKVEAGKPGHPSKGGLG